MGAVLAFLRVSTRAAAFAEPFSVAEAVARIDAWLSQSPSVMVEPTRRHLGLVAGVLESVGTAGNLVNELTSPRSPSNTAPASSPSIPTSVASREFGGRHHRL